MNTKRVIIGEIEQMAINAIVHQPDDKAAAEKHFSETAKKIVEKALQAVDIMEVGDVCRRAVTGAPRAPEATEAELHEAATEEPSAPVSAAPRGVTTLPPGADGTPPAEATQQPELRPVRQQKLEDIGMTMDKRVFLDENGEIVRINYAGIRHLFGIRPAQLWEIVVAKHETGDDGKASHITVLRDHERVFSGSAFFGLQAAADIAISMMIRKIIGDVSKKHRDHFRNIRKATAMTKAAQAGEVA